MRMGLVSSPVMFRCPVEIVASLPAESPGSSQDAIRAFGAITLTTILCARLFNEVAIVNS